jgi:tRNA nucleotidyltransferase (CCA-adding enzyme)
VRDKLLLLERAGASGAASALISADDDESVDIDIALDNMMGEAFAGHVSSWLVEQGHPPASYGVTACNPDQSKHLATARMKVLGVWVDLVNLRTETYAQVDSRIPDVAIGTPLEDAMRRDLTINALFYNVNTGDVEDFTGHGVSDIRARVVRTPLAPLTTLLDDPLRALRAIRFASRLNFIFHPDLYSACQDDSVHAALGAKVSRERVSIEIDSIMSSAAPIHALGLLVELGLFPVVFRLPPEDEYAGEDRPPEDLPAAALGCLINLDRLCHHGGGGGEAPFSDTRLARYAALLAPVASVHAMFAEAGKRRKAVPLAHYILRAELRMGTKDVAAVATILASSLQFKALVHRGLTEGGGDAAELDRLAVGRLLRGAGPQWPIALQTALLTELSPAVIAETYARGMNAIPETLAKESEAVVAAYASFRAEVEAMGLDGVWDLRPLVDGRELAVMLPRVPRGPLIGKIMTAQADYMIENRGVEVGQVRQWLLETYAEYR